MILVTGVTGFLGKHAFGALLRGSWPVRPLARNAHKYRELFPSGPGVIEADLTRLKRGDLATERITGLVHMASEVWPVNRGDGAFEKANIEGTWAILEALDPSRVERLVLASTLAVHGELRGIVGEATKVAPTSAYARSKLEQERIFEDFAARRGVPLAILRFPSIYGPGQWGGTVLPTFLEAALARRPLEVMNPTFRRQAFLYVEDAASAIIAALGSDAAGVFPIAPDATTSMAELAGAVAAVVGERRGHAVPVRLLEERDPKQIFTVDIGKADRELGWRPKFNLGDGLRAMLEAREDPLSPR